MRLFIVYDTDYNDGEKMYSAVVMKRKDNEETMYKLVSKIKDKYYSKVEDYNFSKKWCLETYIKEMLRLKGYRFISIDGEINVA